MKKFEIDQKVTVFDFPAVITEVVDITKKPHLYGVKFDAHEADKQFVIEAEHIIAQNICDRLNTFEDCVNELGKDHILVHHYRLYEEQMHGEECELEDIEAYLKLRIICAAYNEGWEPTFADDEIRWYVWYYVDTHQNEVDLKNETDKDEIKRYCRVVGRSYHNASASGGLVYASAVSASSQSYASDGSRLAFKNSEKAMSAATKFADIFAKFML